MTLRDLLSMTAGIGVPGFLGYEVGAPLPTLGQILDGTPPANSPPVTEIAVPESAYHYSGGGQPLPSGLAGPAAKGHYGDGKELPGHWRVCPEHAAAGLWSTPSDLANLLLLIGRAWRGQSRLFLAPETAREMLTPQNGGPYGLGAAVADAGGSLVLMKRGQNVGYQGYLVLFPAEGQGMVVMTNSDNGSILAESLIRRAAQVYGWPPLGALAD